MLAGIEAIAAQCNHLIIVSNEVFSGGADYAGETDLYLQALAMVNNAVAAKADASAAWCAACRCTTKEGNAHDSFADDRRGICHVLAVPVPQFDWNEKNMRYSLCAFRWWGCCAAHCGTCAPACRCRHGARRRVFG